jgi:hypothetical protein
MTPSYRNDHIGHYDQRPVGGQCASASPLPAWLRYSAVKERTTKATSKEKWGRNPIRLSCFRKGKTTRKNGDGARYVFLVSVRPRKWAPSPLASLTSPEYTYDLGDGNTYIYPEAKYVHKVRGFLSFSPIPEPGSLLLAVGGLLPLIWSRRHVALPQPA